MSILERVEALLAESQRLRLKRKCSVAKIQPDGWLHISPSHLNLQQAKELYDWLGEILKPGGEDEP